MQISKIAPCLWFDGQADKAAAFYTSIFKDSKIVNMTHFADTGQEIHGRPPGSVMVVAFELAGQSFTALNGGPAFKFNEAISLQVHCESQEEIDYFWSKLSAGGSEGQCGWLKDQFGLSWQIIPAAMGEIFKDGEPEKSGRAMQAMMQMQKIDLPALKRAYDGK